MSEAKKAGIVMSVVAALSMVLVIATISRNLGSSDIEFAPTGKAPASGPVIAKYPLDIDQKTGNINTSPRVSGETERRDNYIIFWPDTVGGFSEGVEYEITISGVTDTEGGRYDDQLFSFVANHNSRHHALQLEVMAEALLEGEAGDPFIALLPYNKANGFIINYVVKDLTKESSLTTSDIVVVVEVLIGQGRFDTPEQHLVNVKTVRADALEWISSQGTDPAGLEIQYLPTDESILN
jgi:hypothetical protein